MRALRASRSTTMSDVTDATNDAALEAAEIAQIDAELRAEREARPKAGAGTVGWVLLVGSALGWIASLALSLDKLALLENPGASLACDISPFISCGTFLGTWQASTFIIPNMFIGLTGFSIMGVVGALYLSRVQLPGWFVWAAFGGVVFSFAFVHWLALNALFAIHALCPWCLVVWAVSAPMFFVMLARLVETDVLQVSGTARRLMRAWVPLSLAWYLLVIVAAIVVFFEQWLVMFGLR